MTKGKTLWAAVALAALPTLAQATCFGEGHEKVTMSCAQGTVWDAETSTCVPSTS